uniref:Uncharacterized protein n=1 Tax=Anguilla anguilla TaxID=7936 RepID=A0A0E9RGX2_ANGAN
MAISSSLAYVSVIKQV